MSVIISFLGLQADEMDDERLRSAFEQAQERIHSMALVHQKLYDARDLSHINMKEYVNDLVSFLLDNHGVRAREVVFESEMEDIPILIDTAMPCGLLLNEIITNSLKHAFPGGRGGTIRVTLHRAWFYDSVDINAIRHIAERRHI